MLSSSPNRNLVVDSCHPKSLLAYTFRATIEQPTKAHTAFFARVSWLNIGPAAAGPAGPAPTALSDKADQEAFLLQVKKGFMYP